MAQALTAIGWDFLTFVLFASFTIIAPLWDRLFGKLKQVTKADYVFATGGVSFLAVMLSIARGTLGVRSVLGFPSELFYRGSGMWETVYGLMLTYPLVSYIFVPVYFNLKITSVYEYIDLRFKSRLVRCLAAGTFIVRQTLSLGIVLYTPSVAISAITGIPYWGSIVGMGAVCIFFTIIGGLKAAINADVIQSVAVILVTMVIIVYGAYESGGPRRVYEINDDDGRLIFMKFTGDLTVRVDTVSALFGQLFISVSQFGCQQNFMQRYVSLKSIKDVHKAMNFNIPIVFLFFSLSWISGMTIYSTYYKCDPFAIGCINKQDEILPFYVEDRLSFLPGFLGIFMATLFNGALVLNVSNLNSIATVFYEDFLSLIPTCKSFNDNQQLVTIKFLTFVLGIFTMIIAFGVGLLSGVIESSNLAFQATSGPLLGCFILAMLVPIANWKGASSGMICGHLLVLWIAIGGFTVDKSPESMLPTSTEECENFNFSNNIVRTNSSWFMQDQPMSLINQTFVQSIIQTNDSTPQMSDNRSAIDNFYLISYMYYGMIGTISTVGIGIIVSCLTQDKEKDSYNSNLLHPWALKISSLIPGPKAYYLNSKKTQLESNSIQQPKP